MTIRFGAAAAGTLLAAAALAACAPHNTAHTYQAPTATVAIPQPSMSTRPIPPTVKTVAPVRRPVVVVKKPVAKPVTVSGPPAAAQQPVQTYTQPAYTQPAAPVYTKPAYTPPAYTPPPPHSAALAPAPAPAPQPAAHVLSGSPVSCRHSGAYYYMTGSWRWSNGATSESSGSFSRPVLFPPDGSGNYITFYGVGNC